jgi:uncharacterized protein (DUF2141 family)
MKKLLSLSLWVLFSGFLCAQENKTGNLEIRITGLRNTKGKVSVNLFDNPDGFPEDPLKSFGWKSVKTVPDTVVIIFEELPFGNYAISVLHDENEDGRMEKSLMGIPREGFAFSNKCVPKFRSPDYKDAVISLKTRRLRTELKMIYY